MKKSTTRRALFLSFVSMFLCFTMLVGTTYAWFTDEVTSGVNKIVAGNLDVELTHTNKVDTDETVDENVALFDNIALWEPGAMVYEKFTVKNAGDLALKYLFTLDVTNESVAGFTDMLKVAVVEDADFVYDRANVSTLTGWNKLSTFVRAGKLDVTANPAVTSETFGIVIWWEPTDHDNDFNKPGTDVSVDVRVNLFATQLEAEKDSFGADYDNGAILPGGGYGVAEAPAVGETEIEAVAKDENGYNVGYAKVPTAALADPTKGVELTIEPTTTDTANFTVNKGAGYVAQTYNVELSNIVDGNTAPVGAAIDIGQDLDPNTVELYHYTTLIDSDYNPNTGYVTFKSADFSPFTVVYDAESVYVAPTPDPNAVPVANITYLEEYVGEGKFEWNSWNGLKPTEGLDDYLEAAFCFKPTQSEEEAEASAYRFWNADFVVSLDRDLDINQILLGGNYGGFGWIGFHYTGDGDETTNDILPAGTEVPLLGYFTGGELSGLTYETVVTDVKEFYCGVGDHGDSLKDAKFTVTLRLTNPEDTTQSVDVATVVYTFGDTYVIQ